MRRRVAAAPGLPLAALLLGLAGPPVSGPPGPARQHVVAVAARQLVVAVVAVEGVRSVAALQPVAPASPKIASSPPPPSIRSSPPRPQMTSAPRVPRRRSGPGVPVIVQPRGVAPNSSTPMHRPQRALGPLRHERAPEHVAAERVAERGHDHALVEREVVVRHAAGVDVDAVAEAPLAVQAREVALEPAQVGERLARRVAEGEEGGVRGDDAVRVRRRRRVGLRRALRAAREAVVDQRRVLVRGVAVRVRADAVDAVDVVAALRLVGRREAPVAVAAPRSARGGSARGPRAGG